MSQADAGGSSPDRAVRDPATTLRCEPPAIGGFRPPGRVFNGSGTFDALAALEVFGDALLASFPFDVYVSKTITLAPRPGNPPPRIAECAIGMLNSIGLPNKGVERFLREELPRLARLPVPLCVSVMGFSRQELAELVARVGERGEVAALELNVSCPNVETGLVVGQDPAETARAVERVRPLTEKPLIVKLTPTAADQAAVARAAEAAGADAVSLVNTFPGTAFDARGSALLGPGRGGLSGPAIKPIALAQVREVATAVSLPVIGMGGICETTDAREYLAAGASFVAVGTASFRDPLAGLAIRRALAAEGQESPAKRAIV